MAKKSKHLEGTALGLTSNVRTWYGRVLGPRLPTEVWERMERMREDERGSARHAYRFVLRDKEGSGVYRTPAHMVSGGPGR